MKPIWRIFRYLKFFPRQIVFNVVFNILAIIFNLGSYVMIVPFVEILFGGASTPAQPVAFAFNQQALSDWMMYRLGNLEAAHGAWMALSMIAAVYLLCSLLSNLFRYLGMYFLSPIRNGMIQRLRDDVYHKITILPISFFNNRHHGDIISRMSNDLGDVEWSVVSTMQSLIKDPVNIIIFTATLIFVSPKLFLYFLLILPVSVFLIAKIGKSLKQNATEGQARLGGVFSLLEETLNGIRDIRSFGQEERCAKEYRKANQDYSHSMVKVALRRELSSPLSEVLGTVGLVAILILGGALVIRGELRSSVFIFFVIVFARLIPPVQALVKAYNSLQKGSAAAARFLEILDADEKIVECPNAVVLPQFQQQIEYRHVGFSYTEQTTVEVLHDINLVIPKGERIAIVGASGAGKTTLADLLPRFYDCGAGQILFDGVDIKDANINSLRSQMGIVSQNCILFNDTIASNIAFGAENVEISKVIEAAKVAHAHEFVTALSQGYDTPIGDRGVTLSGGQRQRISIARAVLKNPPILILDEATSALDSESQVAVQQALDQLMVGRTTIIIAHRLSTIQNAHRILVMDKGKIVEQGTHKQLLQQGGIYKQLVDMQEFM